MAASDQPEPEPEPGPEADGDERAEDGLERNETPLEKLDRNTTELLAEMRVAAVGIQVLLAFLLIVPFNAGWRRATRFDRDEYFVTLVFLLAAAVLLIAPVIHHRLLFRRHQKAYLIDVGNRLTIVAMVLQAFGLTGILVLIAHFLFGTAMAIATGVIAGAVVVVVWFALPLSRRRTAPRFPVSGGG